MALSDYSDFFFFLLDSSNDCKLMTIFIINLANKEGIIEDPPDDDSISTIILYDRECACSSVVMLNFTV